MYDNSIVLNLWHLTTGKATAVKCLEQCLDVDFHSLTGQVLEMGARMTFNCLLIFFHCSDNHTLVYSDMNSLCMKSSKM